MAAFLFRCELVLEMHAAGTGLDHRLHQLIGVQRSAEPGFCISNDRRHPIRAVVRAFAALDLIGAAQRGVDPAHHVGHGIHRVKRLVGIHLPRGVGIGGDLPARQVDRLQPGLDLLHGLVAGQRAERGHELLGLQQVPQPCRAHLGQRMADAEGTGQARNVLRRVVAVNAGEALWVAAGRGHAVGHVGRGRTHRMSPWREVRCVKNSHCVCERERKSARLSAILLLS